MRKLGGTTFHSIGDISRRQTFAADDAFVPPQVIVQRLLDDSCHIAERQRAAIAICDKHRDAPTRNILQEFLDQTERRIWFLYKITWS